MRPRSLTLLVLAVPGALALGVSSPAAHAGSLESSPPVVIKTVPAAGSREVDPKLAEIAVTFSKPMQDGSWSVVQQEESDLPEISGKPKYRADRVTCVLPVKLKPGKFYAVWFNTDRFRNFKDPGQRPALPYLLTFQTKSAP